VHYALGTKGIDQGPRCNALESGIMPWEQRFPHFLLLVSMLATKI